MRLYHCAIICINGKNRDILSNNESYGKHQSEVKLQVSLSYKSIYICVCVVHHRQSIVVIYVHLLSEQTQAGPICDSFKLGAEPVG